MGSLLRHRKHKKELITALSPVLYNNILWLNDNIYIFDKHAFSNLSAKTIAEEEEARLFQLDEAVAIYLIARYLGFSLLSRLGLLETYETGIEQKLD